MKAAKLLRRHLGDPAMLGLALVLATLGVAMIYSAGQVEVRSVATGIWARQLVWLGLAVGAFWAAMLVPPRWLEWAAPWAYGLAILLLMLVLAVGTGPARSWIALGPLRMQPAEFAKLATILLLARTLAGRELEMDRLADLWRPVLIVFVPFALVLLQPDLGSALIFGVILMAGLYWAGVPLATVLLLVSPAVSLVLGFIGVILPLMPTAPFLVVAAACFAKTDPAMQHRMFRLPIVGRYLGDIASGKALPPVLQFLSILFVWASVLYASLVLVKSLWVKLALYLLGALATLHVLLMGRGRRRDE